MCLYVKDKLMSFTFWTALKFFDEAKISRLTVKPLTCDRGCTDYRFLANHWCLKSWPADSDLGQYWFIIIFCLKGRCIVTKSLSWPIFMFWKWADSGGFWFVLHGQLPRAGVEVARLYGWVWLQGDKMWENLKGYKFFSKMLHFANNSLEYCIY